MVLFLANNAGRAAAAIRTTTISHLNPTTRQQPPHTLLRLPLPPAGRRQQVVSASRRSKGGKTRRSTTKEEQEAEEIRQWRSGMAMEDDDDEDDEDNGYVLPDLPGLEPDFWEGEQWDGLGFFVQYMWAFGVLFALVACGIAVVTYNDGATDFKETPAYQESIQPPELFEEPEGSNADVFESNPTEVAPSLE